VYALLDYDMRIFYYLSAKGKMNWTEEVIM
jgi:hypothetical protein